MNKKFIIFYIITKNHLRLADIFIKNNKQYNYKFVYEKNINLLKINDLLKIKNNFYEINEVIFNDNFFNESIVSAFFFNAQLRESVFKLILKFRINNIPCHGFQETNQFFLHQNKLNNYLLPLDKLLVNSNYEKEKFMKLNYSNNQVKVIGYNYLSNKIEYKLNSKNKKNVLVILNASPKNNNFSIEDKEFLQEFLYEISNFKDYDFYFKYHPVDTNYWFDKIINKNQNFFKVENEYNVLEILNSFDCLLSTGYTQAIFEAINNEKKIIIYNPYDHFNPFLKYLKKLNIKKVENIPEIINTNIELNEEYAKIKNEHIFVNNNYENLFDKLINYENNINNYIKIDKINELLLLYYMIFSNKFNDLIIDKEFNFERNLDFIKKIKLNNWSYEYFKIFNKFHSNLITHSILIITFIINSDDDKFFLSDELKKYFLNKYYDYYILFFYKQSKLIEKKLNQYNKNLLIEYSNIKKSNYYQLYKKNIKNNFLNKIISKIFS